MEQEIKKIVIIGPESTGKSTLCEQLAQHYNTSWVREYAREYLEQNGTDYGFEDLWETIVLSSPNLQIIKSPNLFSFPN